MKLLILDAGHAKSTRGKRNTLASPDFFEYVFNNDMQYKIKQRAEAHGITVKLTNPDPANVRDIPLTTRANKANEFYNNAGKPRCLFISLHANAAGSCAEWANARGVEVYHASNASQETRTVAERMSKQIYDDVYATDKGFRNRGRKQSNFTVIYKTRPKAILIEYGFYDNRQDLNVLNNKRNVLVEATMKQICNYFGIAYKPPTGGSTASNVPSGTDWKNGSHECRAKATTELNIRAGRPGSSGYNTILKTIPAGTIVNCKYCLDGWVSTYDFSNIPGFIRTKYLQKI